MFCFNCGAELIDNAKFCSSCGTAVHQAPTKQLEQSMQNDTQGPVHKPLQNVEIFNLLGYEVTVLKKTELYVSIRNEFHQLAKEAWAWMSQKFDTKYHSLDDLVRYGDNDADDLYGSALEHAVDVLKSCGVYNISLSQFNDVALEYTGYWDTNFYEIREKFKELVEYKEAKKEHRSIRKAGRGKVIGGGFGVGGAVKGMAMAGTANMATGMLHSFVNALGNAATSGEVSSMKNKIFKDPDMRRTLCLSVYYDVFCLHRAVVECIADDELSLAAELYTNREREEALTIYNNITDGSVSDNDLRRAIVDILINDPFDMDYYKLALNHTLDGDVEGLINYARYFMMPINDLIQELQSEAENRERLAHLFGEFAADLELKLQYNSIFQALKSNLPVDPPRTIQEAYYSILSDSVRDKTFLIRENLSDKITKKLDNAKMSYAPFQAELPLLLFDNTAFGSAKDGFLVTDQRIYVHNMMTKGWNARLQEINEMSLSGSAILINGNSVDINLISGKDRDDFFEFVELLIYVQKYSHNINAQGQSLDPGTQSAKLEISATVSAYSEQDKNIDKVIEDIRSNILSIKNAGIRKYLFIEHENEKVIKKFKNAFETYAKIESDEKPIVLFDNTGFGSAKDGCLLTNRRIYIHNMMQKPVKINISDIVSVKLKGSDLSFNNYSLGINMISSSDRAEFKALMEDLIDLLR